MPDLEKRTLWKRPVRVVFRRSMTPTTASLQRLPAKREARTYFGPRDFAISYYPRHSGERRVTERTCGTCSLCCKLAYIPELNKSIDSWCRHARPGAGGCSIYPDRPTSCRNFTCGWLVGARELGDEWFSARCKMIVSPREPRYNLAERGMLVTVDPAYPNAWRRKPYYVQLLGWAQHVVVEIRVARRCIRLNADCTEQEATKTQAWLEGRKEPSPVMGA